MTMSIAMLIAQVWTPDDGLIHSPLLSGRERLPKSPNSLVKRVSATIAFSQTIF